MQIILITIQQVFFKDSYSLEYFTEHEKKKFLSKSKISIRFHSFQVLS